MAGVDDLIKPWNSSAPMSGPELAVCMEKLLLSNRMLATRLGCSELLIRRYSNESTAIPTELSRTMRRRAAIAMDAERENPLHPGLIARARATEKEPVA